MSYNRTDGMCECGCGRPAPTADRTYSKRQIFAGEPMRFIPGHQNRKSAVEYVVSTTGCWIWQLARTAAGYGTLRVDGLVVYAHRYFYETHVGPIPPNRVIDHLCRVPPCVNPAHLEAVTQRLNIERGDAPKTGWTHKTHCVHGHEFTPANTYVNHGKRSCKACALRRAAAWKRARRQLMAS